MSKRPSFWTLKASLTKLLFNSKILFASLYNIMRSLLVLASVVAITAGQFTTSIHETAPVTITSASASTARPASAATTSYARYTPIKSIDPWQCATKNISDYLLPPMPTGDLLNVYYDHSGAIYRECEEHIPKPFTSYPACPSVAKASWCAVSHN